jgi:predicted NBD/HSP70 family sugar kinase
MSSQRGLTVTDTANSNLQNQINISIIFNYIKSQGSAYRAQIARDLGISAPAVSRAVEKLLRDGYLTEYEKTRGESGRKAVQFSINAGRGYIIGVDILTDPIEIAISDFAGTTQYSRKGPSMDEEADLTEFLRDAIDGAYASFQKEAGLEFAKILAIGIGVPAVVDPITGEILSASLYKNLANSDFSERLREHYGIPVFVENISNLAAIGEWMRGAGKGVRNMVFFELSNGIGAGIILDGDLYRGALGSAGEVGYCINNPGGLGHDNSRWGYLESVASLEALRERGAREGYGASGLGSDMISRLCEASSAGDEKARMIIREFIDHLAVTIVNIMAVLNPEMVIIGGNICEIAGAESEIARPLIEEIQLNYPFKPATVRLTLLGSRASVLGALQFALDSLVVNSYPYRIKTGNERAHA